VSGQASSRTAAPSESTGRASETRARIFDAAAGLLAEQGYDFTLEDVATAAGTTRMTVYRHVGTREEMLTSLVLRASNDLVGDLRAALEAEAPFVDRIEESVLLIVQAVRSAPYLTAVTTSANPSDVWPRVDPEGRFVGAVFEFFRPYFEAATDEVRFRAGVDESLDWLLRQVLSLLTVDSRGDAPLDEVRHLVRTFVVPSIVAG
jgi:AcrR family transcriptional regulator